MSKPSGRFMADGARQQGTIGAANTLMNIKQTAAITRQAPVVESTGAFPSSQELQVDSPALPG